METIVSQDSKDGLHGQKNPQPLRVIMRREPFDDQIKLTLPDGSSDEFDTEQTRSWFKARGANMDVIEEALTQIWNFYDAVVTIKNPKPLVRFTQGMKA